MLQHVQFDPHPNPLPKRERGSELDRLSLMSTPTDEFDAIDETLRVLIVEDEPRLRDLLLHALPDMGFTGDAAKSGEEAVKIMEKQPHQVIVLDLNLPGMSGLELKRRGRRFVWT